MLYKVILFSVTKNGGYSGRTKKVEELQNEILVLGVTYNKTHP